ncbi:HAAS signaling domain-containing protein [Cytobacillus gottheilii]|uniref:HAAS signaling domain-containing protein n=1 Tax=Cytobacillus gottheilii TaxID=859144 RepID=UPI0009BAFD4B|nr:hypothetical protein [Cytobacillus gottheilii]
MQNLIEIYIQEVTRRLPEKNRSDIALELRSTIEDMLPDEHNEADVKSVLEKLGNPVALAGGYRDQPMHLIGPRYYDLYISLLKMILPIAVVVSFITMVASYFIQYNGEEDFINFITTLITKGIITLVEVGVGVLFWITIVFAVIERTDTNKGTDPVTNSLTKWTPEVLKQITYVPKKKAVSKSEIFGSFIWSAIWISFYFNANHLIGLYEDKGNGLEFVQPVFHQDVLIGYWPIVVTILALEVALAIYKYVKGQWTKRLAILNLIVEAAGVIVLLILFINPNLLQEEFFNYFAALFSASSSQLQVGFISVTFLVVLVFAVISIVDGFRKARIK